MNTNAEKNVKKAKAVDDYCRLKNDP